MIFSGIHKGDNHATLNGTSITVTGVNYGKVLGTENFITTNAGEVVGTKRSNIGRNVAGGRVTAKTIIYAAQMELSADKLNGETKTSEFNGVVVTLTFAGPNEWHLESENVINKVTILQDGMLLLEHISGGEVTDNNVKNTTEMNGGTGRVGVIKVTDGGDTVNMIGGDDNTGIVKTSTRWW